MKLEIIVGIIAILGFAVWALIYIFKRTKENNNEHLFDFIPHLFPTLGILFTFIGIAYGLYHFDSNNIEKSIPELMNGLKTAFYVSIAGVSLLVVFSFITNVRKKILEEGVLSDETKAIQSLTEAIKELRNDFLSSNEIGHTLNPGNILRDLYNESIKQSESLQSFSTELALNISENIDNILNNPTEGVLTELKSLKLEIEALGNKLKDPATDMTQSIVKELQGSMSKMIEDFRVSMSGDTKNEMERLAEILGKAGGSLTEFPDKLQNMMQKLDDNFKGLQSVVKKISDDSLLESEKSMKNMRDQVEAMSITLKEKVGDLQSGQDSLFVKQTENLKLSEELIRAFNDSVKNMNSVSKEINGSISKFTQYQSDMERVSSNFKAVSLEIGDASKRFESAQSQLKEYSTVFLDKNKSTIFEIEKSLHLAEKVADSYSNRFEVIDSGLQGIFEKITKGLNDYQNTVGSSLDKYLEKYTDSLTSAAQALGGASSAHQEILEGLSDQLDKLGKIRI